MVFLTHLLSLWINLCESILKKKRLEDIKNLRVQSVTAIFKIVSDFNRLMLLVYLFFMPECISTLERESFYFLF